MEWPRLPRGKLDYPESIGGGVSFATAGCHQSGDTCSMRQLDRRGPRVWRRLRLDRFALELTAGVADGEIAVWWSTRCRGAFSVDSGASLGHSEVRCACGGALTTGHGNGSGAP